MPKKTVKRKRGYGLQTFGGLLIGASSVAEVIYILSKFGVPIFEEISLTDPMKIFISLCLFLSLTSATSVFAGAYLIWRGYNRIGGFTSFIGGLLALSNLATPLMFGHEVSQIFCVGTLLGYCLMAVGVELGFSTSPLKVEKGPILTSVEVATVAVFSALYAVMIILVKIPSPTGGFTHFGDFIVFVAALLFGYKAGGLVGIIGSVAADLFTGYSRWFVSILAHGLEGVIPGLTKKRSLPLQLVACIIGGFLMATTYFFINIFIKGYPPALISYVRDLFVQAGISIVIALPVVKIVRKASPRLQ